MGAREFTAAHRLVTASGVQKSTHTCSAAVQYIMVTPCGSVGFFFQAEDGIRDVAVTGVQTCALPIWQHVDDLPEDLPTSTPRLDSSIYLFAHHRRYLIRDLFIACGQPQRVVRTACGQL